MTQGIPAPRSLAFGLVLALLAPPAFATCGGGGGGGVGGVSRGGGFQVPGGSRAEDPEVYQVPWKALVPGEVTPAGLLVLYWFPTSAKEQHSSDLQSSRPLTLAAGHCVGMGVVGVDNTELREKYKVTNEVSTAVLVVAADGTELGRVQAKYGRPAGRDEVEKLLKDGIKRQEKAAGEQ